MEIYELIPPPHIDHDKKLKSKYVLFEKLISELKKREIPPELIQLINQHIQKINGFTDSDKELRKQIQKSQLEILKISEKELKLVPKNLYRNKWMAIGMSVFGIPMGVAFGTSLNNMGLIGIGIPIGMVIGLAIGAGMDKKALDEGRQLDLEIN